MIGYLFYDIVDIERNQTFIDWFIKEAKSMDMTLVLKTEAEDTLPDFVINRSRKPEISKYYKKHEIPIFNSLEVTSITNDKLKTYEYFKDTVRMLATKATALDTDYPVVVKHRFGHGGTDVHLIGSEEEMIPYLTEDYIMQPLSPLVGKDLRVYIMGNEILEAIIRSNEHSFKANYSLGGQIALYTLSQAERDIIETILRKMPLDYGGIDFLFDANNQLILNEVEDAVGARMLYNLTQHNIVKLYLSHIRAKLNVN